MEGRVGGPTAVVSRIGDIYINWLLHQGLNWTKLREEGAQVG